MTPTPSARALVSTVRRGLLRMGYASDHAALDSLATIIEEARAFVSMQPCGSTNPEACYRCRLLSRIEGRHE